MAIVEQGRTTSLKLILNNGTTETGRIKQLSIDVAGGQEMKPYANFTPSYNIATAVKALYSQPEIARRRTSKYELVSNE